jgi:hypothetical protein
MGSARACARRLAIVVLAVAASGCWVTETEMVRAADSLQLAGRRVTMAEPNGDPPTVYTWDAARAGYLDPEASGLLRFAHLRGEVYLAQIEILKADKELMPAMRAGRRVFAVMLVRLAPPKLIAQHPSCAKYADEITAIARPFGVAVEPRREFAISGTRDGILGFMAATLSCNPETLDALQLTADSVTPGGPELAPGGAPAAAAAARPTAIFERRCAAGELPVCFRLAQILRRGEGVPADPARAAALLEKVCADPKGDVEACVDLAQLHDRGEGVEQDPARATELLKKACAAGEMYGCDLLKRRPD